jgi:drug/metabolite transporter superfamily protein YnfA
MQILNRLVANPAGAVAFLFLAAFLEAFGDSMFQTAFYRQTGAGRWLAIGLGGLVLAAYGATVNLPRWDFGRLLGVYVAAFFVVAQVLNKVRFGQAPTLPIWVGGSLVVAGGLVMALWQR